MKNSIIYLGILFMSAMVKMVGQESFEIRAKKIAEQIEKITQEEKVSLKMKIASINTDLEKGIITREQAEEKKLKFAQESAKTIESRVVVEQNKLSQLVKEKVDGQITVVDTTDTYKTIKINLGKMKFKKLFGEKRHITEIVFAMGLNNVVTNDKVANSDFRYYGSHFYEWGLMMNSRLLKEDNLLHLRYGLALQYNNLRATNNRLFVKNNEKTLLEVAPMPLSDSRFKTINLVMPMFVEFDFSKSQNTDGKKLFRTHQGMRIGLGGHLGVNLSAKQYLEYTQNGNDISQIECGEFNVNKFVYGLGAYIGYKDTSLYLKYDMNPLFANNTVDQNNVSLGVRFDFN